MIIRYDSSAHLARDYIKRVPGGRQSTSSGLMDSWDRYWYNGETVEDTLRFAEIGDTRLVAEAEALMDKLDTSVETPRKVWDRGPIGAYCAIPDYIAGLPTPMRNLVSQPDEKAPITVIVDMGTSGGIGSETVKKRGIVILALVMALIRVRTVSLHYLDCGSGTDADGESITTFEINTHPLDLATACYVLTSCGFTRRLTYAVEEKINGFSGGWPKKMKYGQTGPYYESLKPRLSADPSRCLIIGAAQMSDKLLQKPLEWVQEHVERFTKPQEGDVE